MSINFWIRLKERKKGQKKRGWVRFIYFLKAIDFKFLTLNTIKSKPFPVFEPEYLDG